MKEEKARIPGTSEDPELNDPAIRRLLRLWEVPDGTPELDARVIASFRRRTGAPLWRRLFTASIPVPLPVAAIVLILLMVSATLALRRPATMKPEVSRLAASPLTAQPLDTPVVTRTSLAGFEPVTDMNVAVVPELH